MYIEGVQIDGIKAFSNATACVFPAAPSVESPEESTSYAGFHVIAGRNGAGKSSFLKAVAAAIAGPELAGLLDDSQSEWVSHGRKSGHVSVQLQRAGHESIVGRGKLSPSFDVGLAWERVEGVRSRPRKYKIPHAPGGTLADRGPWSSKPEGWFCAGYGPFRRISGSSGDAARIAAGDWTTARFATLFREDASLSEAVQWLQQINYRAQSQKFGYSQLESHVLALFNDGLFPDGAEASRVDPDGLWITRNDEELLIEEMSDGYRSVTALVTDIIRQIHRCFNESVEFKAAGTSVRILNAGVVLIDEIDAHLHVSWQREIGPWLKTHFPNIQFIVTTHSPFVAQTADEGGLLRLFDADGSACVEVVSPELHKRITRGSADDAVVSELFGLDSPYAEEHEAIRARLAQLERLSVLNTATDADLSEFATLVEELSPSIMSRASAQRRPRT